MFEEFIASTLLKLELFVTLVIILSNVGFAAKKMISQKGDRGYCLMNFFP